MRVAARGLSHTDPVPKQGHTGSLRAPARAPGAPGGTVCLPAGLVDWDVSTWPRRVGRSRGMAASKLCEKSRGWGRARAGDPPGHPGVCAHTPPTQPRGLSGPALCPCTLDAGCGLNIRSRRGRGAAWPWVAHGGPGGRAGGRQQPQEVGSRPGDREPLGEEEPGTKEVQRG